MFLDLHRWATAPCLLNPHRRQAYSTTTHTRPDKP
jgi:hypothetical protein